MAAQYPTRYHFKSAEIGFIYALCDKRTGEVRYIGKTTRSLQYRLDRHRWAATALRNHLHYWIKSVGVHLKIRLMEQVAIVDIDAAEAKWIAQYRSSGHLINIKSGGEGGGTFSLTPEQRAKISASNRKRFENPEARRRIGDLTRARAAAGLVKGHPVSRKTKERLSLAHLGKPKSLTARAAMSAAARKRANSHNGRAELLKRLAKTWGSPSPERRTQLSEALIGRPKSDITKERQKQAWAQMTKDEKAARVAPMLKASRQPKSAETREKCRLAAKARWAKLSAEERRQRMREIIKK